MALTKDMNLEQIKSFLEEELKEQILLDIAPILYIGQKVGGYFGVTRQILCLVDFLGALYRGYDGKRKNKRMVISETWKAKELIKGVFGDIDPKYRENGEVLYDMYRHGLVHLYQPRAIKQENGRKLEWVIYKGPRERAAIKFGERVIQNVRHLGVTVNPSDKKTDLLTISITCLYKDLLTAIDRYYVLLENDKSGKLLKNWKAVANAIAEAEDYSIIKEPKK